MQVTVNPEYLERFQDALSGLGTGADERVLLAVSGGPDSLALLALAREARPGRISAATVDHRLRPEAADEAAYVAAICRDLDIPHAILSPGAKIEGNVQSGARRIRYALLETAADEQGCSMIATAHHGDDQIETLLMRLVRGSGVDGMAAIRRRNGRVIRPLLSFSKLQLEEICVDAGLKPVRDPSNENSDFDRIKIRKWLALSPHPFNVDRANRTATAFGDAAETLAWLTEQHADTRITQKRDILQCDASGLPRELKRRLLLNCLCRLEPNLQPKGDAIDRLLGELSTGNTAMIGDIICTGGEVWRFTPAPPRRSDS